jgi:hypothetical protein
MENQRHNKLMQRMGRVIVENQSSFIDMLDSADVDASNYDAPEVLIDKYVDALPDNEELQVMSAFILEDVDRSSFNGKIENDDVYRNYEVMYHYWKPESQSNVAGAIAGAVQGVAGLGTKALELRQQKKFGALNLAQKKADSKTALIQSVIAQKQAKAEADKAKQEAQAKKTKYWLIGGGVVLGLAIIGITIYMVRKK